MRPQDEAPRLKDLGIEKNQKNSSHDERGSLKLKNLLKNSVRTEKIVHKQPRTRFKRQSPPGCLNLPTNNSRLP